VALNPAICFWKMLAFLFLPAILETCHCLVCPSNKHCPSARCAYAASAVGKDLDIRYLHLEPIPSITFILINLKLLALFVHNSNILCYEVLVNYPHPRVFVSLFVSALWFSSSTCL
jgi:hypothetical protein